MSEYEDYLVALVEFDCEDCGINTSALGIDEYYMVHDEVWAQTGLGGDDGMLCLVCIEARIGRNLEASDFTNIKMNQRWILEYANG